LICKEEVYNEGLSTLVMSEPLVAPLIDYAYGKREGDIISFEGERYKIIKCLKKKNKMIEEKYDGSLDLRANAIRIDTLYVAPNGGYFTMEEFHEGIELVYVLLFSPYTQRYELTQATYYKSKNRYGMDIGLFKSFVEEYGKPDVELRFREPGGTPGEFGYDLRDESILRAWGYSVAAQDDLSPDTRQNILAYIVDLGIMNVAQIVRFLYFLVESRKDGKYSEARKKWMEDILFIQSYRVNPERFIIPDMIVRK